MILYKSFDKRPHGQAVKTSPSHGENSGSIPLGATIKTHAKGAYLALPRVSFSMQNRGKLPFSW